jgi:hypothetical protein
MSDLVSILTEKLSAAETERDSMRSELARLHSWDGLMELLDEHWPADIFTGESGDPGPRMIVAIREIDRLRSRLAAADRRCGCPNCCGGAAADHRHDKHGTHCPDLRKILGEKP